MKTTATQALVFCLAVAASGFIWSRIWTRPEPEFSAPMPAIEPLAVKPWTSRETAATMAALRDAATGDARMKAAAALGQIPVDQVRAALEAESPVADGKLTLAAKVLLIRWVGSDVAAATDWAWKRFRSEGLWQEAFQEIGPAWAWHDARGLHRWAMTAPKEQAGEHVTMAEAEASESPILDSEDRFAIARWLAAEEPRLAFEFRAMDRNVIFSDDHKMPSLLRSVTQVKEALLAFDDLDQIKPGVIQGHQMLQVALLGRWKELDPEDFARSPYADFLNEDVRRKIDLEAWKKVPAEERAAAANVWRDGKEGFEERARTMQLAREWAALDLAGAAEWVSTLPERRREEGYQIITGALAAKDLGGTLEWTDSLPAATKAAALVQAFDGWSKEHPGQRPDTSGWSAERIAAWEDLEEGGVPIR